MESDNKSDGANAAAGGSSGGRLLVEECFADVQNDRTRFEIELKHGETTIVSWAKLLEDSGIAVDQSPPPSPQPPRTAVSRGMSSAKSTKNRHARVKSITVKSQTSEVNNGIFELPDLNIPYTVQAARLLRDMVPSACGGDAVRFTQIKKEVIEMIKLRNPLKDSETMELHAANKTKYSISMEHEMEDKICDFYDIYVQGMDGVKSSEIRKFYIQVAGLWPNGTMDNHGIRNAICRSKQRRRTALQQKDDVVPGT